MKLPQKACLTFFFIVSLTSCFAQRGRYAIKNTIGLQGGITQFDIITDNFETKSRSGYTGGLAASVDLSPKWYNLSYNIQLSENNIEISGSELNGDFLMRKQLEYKMLAAQISLLLHAKLIGNNLTLDVGPMLQYNGKLDLQSSNEENLSVELKERSLSATDIEDISRFNVNGAVGFSLGFNRFKIRAQYQYGFTNMLNKLNDQDFDNTNKFEGHQSLFMFTALVNF